LQLVQPKPTKWQFVKFLPCVYQIWN